MTIPCIGVDGKIHICHPHEKKCLCGVNVKRKLDKLTDTVLKIHPFSCGECDCLEDDEKK